MVRLMATIALANCMLAGLMHPPQTTQAATTRVIPDMSESATETPRERVEWQVHEAIERMQLPEGVALTGLVQVLERDDGEEEVAIKSTHESHEMGLGGLNMNTSFRLAVSFDGMFGWAYPMGLWNMARASFDLKACNMGFSYAGYYYC